MHLSAWLTVGFSPLQGFFESKFESGELRFHPPKLFLLKCPRQQSLKRKKKKSSSPHPVMDNASSYMQPTIHWASLFWRTPFYVLVSTVVYYSFMWVISLSGNLDHSWINCISECEFQSLVGLFLFTSCGVSLLWGFHPQIILVNLYYLTNVENH